MSRWTLKSASARLAGVGALGTVVLALSACAPAQACPPDAQRYWDGFRQAALQGDAAKVAALTRFPLVVRGTLDDEKPRMVTQKQFPALLKKMMSADSGTGLEPKTMKAYVETQAHLTPAHCIDPRQFEVGIWVFLLTPEGWRFVQTYE